MPDLPCPIKAIRSPDGAFITKERWRQVPAEDKKKFAHICPDFVIELLSESDREKVLQAKMKEWIDNGCHLAWLINPKKRETRIYRKKGKVEVKPFSSILDGEDVLPGFTINLTKVFKED